MTKQSVLDAMAKLKLQGAMQALEAQLKSKEYESKSFLVRLNHLLTEQLLFTTNKRIATLQRQAKLRWPQATIAQINYQLQSSLKPDVIAELAELNWIHMHRHLIISGPTGTGKTYLASAFGQQAILNTIPVLFCRYNDLILQLMAADKEECLSQFRKKLNRIPLLIIDDWGISPLSPIQRHLIFELIESRDQNASLIITSQYPVTDWHDAFQDPTIADSVLDRIVHNAHHLQLDGDSIRKELNLKEVSS